MRRLPSHWPLLILATCSCMPSREAKTAGQIGCTPDEITISREQSQFGVIQSSETWTAECQGRIFVCSQINHSGRDKGFLDMLFASEQVSCHEAAESPDAERSRHAQEAALTDRANRLPSAPPKGAAGFEFGENPEDAARRCQVAGQTWRDDSGDKAVDTPGCSGPATPLGMDASVAVSFCSGRVCSITVDHVPRANWKRSAVALKANLEAKYGISQESSGSVPEDCRSEQAFTRCLESQQVLLQYKWTWNSGESIEMIVGKLNEADNTAIRLVYRRLAGANQSAL
ncbi:MAG: hypothetical protein ACM3ZE_03320 [Myxococcales bacterium]